MTCNDAEQEGMMLTCETLSISFYFSFDGTFSLVTALDVQHELYKFVPESGHSYKASHR